MNKLILCVMVLLCGQSAVCGETSESADQVESQFYEAIGRSDVDTALRLLHPAVRELVDRPVMEAWTSAVRDELGQHRATVHTDRTETQELTARRVEFTSTVTFAKGTARSSMSVLNGQIVAFEVQSDLLQNWFQGPTTTDVYAQQAETFIDAFLFGKDQAAFAMMHPALQDVIPQKKLQGMMDTVMANGGSLKQAELQGSRFTLSGASPTLYLTYAIECERASGQCEIEFQFVGMKGHLLGFSFR